MGQKAERKRFTIQSIQAAIAEDPRVAALTQKEDAQRSELMLPLSRVTTVVEFYKGVRSTNETLRSIGQPDMSLRERLILRAYYREMRERQRWTK